MKSAALLPLLFLAGCGLDQLLIRPAAQSPPPEPLPPPRSTAAEVDVSAGLAPLPTPQQVLAAVPFGRTDPFAAYPVVTQDAATAAARRTAAAGGGRPGSGTAGSPSAAPGAPEGFVLHGVIRSGGRAEALVTYGSVTGSLRPGDRGGRTTTLLPQGWVLASIHLGGRTLRDPPSITLVNGRDKVNVRLL